MNRAIKEFLKTSVLRKIFAAGQLVGLDILPRHFYSELPDLRKLAASKPWRAPYWPPVSGWNDLDCQLQFTRNVLGICGEDISDLHKRICDRAEEAGYGGMEASALVSFIRTQKPPIVIQIGCGVSTAAVLHGAQIAGYKPSLLCIEPYPSQFLQRSAKNGDLELWQEPAQDVLAKLNDRAEAMPTGSLLFIDSTHALGPAGECTRLICETLPRLRDGCFAHFHDILFPYDYQRHTLTKELFFQHESALLMAFLCCNPRFEIAASFAMLHYHRTTELAKIFPGYRPQPNADGLALSSDGHFPSSCWLRCIG